MIKIDINTSKNLLAFSAGIDSSALFFLLLENGIPFDIAIVNYNQRAQALQEVQYAKDLAKKYNKKCFIKEVNLNTKSNFEKKARDIRYDFFEKIIKENSYKSLITAHQLNDSLEWFLMQLFKGAGLVELLGLKEREEKDDYYLLRPLLQYDKEELLNYLKKNKHKYFIDESNSDFKYTRNKIRSQFSNEFISLYKEGIKKSFTYMKEDLNSLNINIKEVYKEKKLKIFEKHEDDNINIRIIDKVLKTYGVLISAKTRALILKDQHLVVSHKLCINIKNDYIWICPYIEETMDKNFKEKCRINKIPKNIRPYLYSLKKDEIFLNNLKKY